MNKHIKGFFALIALLLCAPAQSGLVRVGSEQNYVFGSEDLTGQLAYDVNSATGDFVLCYGAELSTFDRVYCRLFNEGDAPVSSVVQHDFSSPPQQRIATIDVSVADNGNFYAVVMTIRSGTRATWLHGWTRLGSPLFAPFQVDATLRWFDVAVAATHNGPWVGATVEVPDTSNLNVVARSYTTTGALLSNLTLATYSTATLTSSCLELDRNSDIAANRSGDVAVTWIKPNFSQFCNGTVMTQTLRAGGSSSAIRPISAVVRDGMGRDASPNTRPHIAALDNGRFALSWLDIVAHTSVTATIDQANAIIVAESDMMPAQPSAPVEFGANPINGDFAVAAEETISSCDLKTQLAIEGNLVPLARFSVGGCFNVMHHALQFLRNGQLRVARSYFDHISLSRVDLPAQIEVNNVTVSEGNPVPGTPPSAAISVTLTKPHPGAENVQVAYYTRNGTAAAGQDYELTQNTVVFNGASQQTAQTILLPLIPDALYEDDEHFTVEFELPVNALIRNGDERSTVVIRDDDSTPLITPDCVGGDPLNCKSQPEPGPTGSVEFYVHLNMAQPVSTDVQINYTTADGTAHAGSDYDARSGSVQIIAGATTATIPLTVLGDNTLEDTESFHLRLSAPAAVHLSATDLSIHITDSDVCFLQVAPSSVVTTHVGSTETVNITTRPGCQWTASVRPQDDWIDVTPPSQTGSGSVSLVIEPFTAQPPVYERGGKLTIALTDPPMTAITIDVDQDGECGFTVTQDSQLPTPPQTDPVPFDVAGGTGQFTVDATVPECAWTVVSPVPWITILEPTMPTFGDATVRYRVDANADQVNVGNNARNVALISEEFAYNVAQNGCDYVLTPPSITFDAQGKVSIPVTVTAAPVCQWTAVSNDNWILIANGSSGSGNGVVGVYAVDNPALATRLGSVAIGGQTLNVNQTGVQCIYSLAPASVSACPDGRSFSVNVSATDGCSWTVHSDAPWVTLFEGSSGIGGDQTSGIIDLNLSEIARTSTLELRAQNIGVATAALTQEGFLTYEVFNAARPADWSYAPSAAWSTAGGNLVAQASGQGSAIALDQESTCSDCAIDASVAITAISSSPGDVLTMLGWYRSEVNHVGLAMNEFSNRWTLYQMVNGTRYSVMANVEKIIPSAFYDIRLIFNGTTFTAEVGGVALLQMPLQGNPPTGSAGLMLTASNGRLAELRVSRIAPNVVIDPDRIFSGGFEADEVPNISQCRLVD